jgi:phage-related protein
VPFTGGRELARRSWLWRPPPTYQPLRVCRPRTWLLERGWQLAGSVGTRDVPGSI